MVPIMERRHRFSLLYIKRTTSKEHSAALKEEINDFIVEKCLFEIVSRRNMCDRKRFANLQMSCRRSLNVCVLLGIHFTKYHRFECEFYHALC